MSIRVQGISKQYGSQLAVDQVSFDIAKGEIVGFIGPNGAGKSTSMKIICGTLPPDHGKVLIQDLPVQEHPLKIRRLIGYLPEHNPLYLELYIREYLLHVAGLYGIRRQKGREKVDEVIAMTGLKPEAHKKIGSLSKGFRQRVGLAQALVHDPEILILDEPTTGLDPNQLVEIRQLISRIGKEKTILLSTHILQEVEAICDRVLIINKGRIVADDRAEVLKEQGRGSKQTILIELEEAIEIRVWEKLSFIQSVKALSPERFLLETSEIRDVRGEISKFIVNQGYTILSLSLKQQRLEEVFKEITQG